MKFLTKKLFSFLYAAVVFIFATAFSVGYVCREHYRDAEWAWCRGTPGEAVGWAGIISMFFLIVFLPAVFTLPFSATLFNRWKRFAARAVPITAGLTVLILWVFSGGGSGFFVSFDAVFIGFFLALLYGWFFLHSLILIVETARKERKKR